jgi:hypothetical protein
MIGTVERNTGQVIEQVAHIAEMFSARHLSEFRGAESNHTLTSRLCKIAHTVAQTNFLPVPGRTVNMKPLHRVCRYITY